MCQVFSAKCPAKYKTVTVLKFLCLATLYAYNTRLDRGVGLTLNPCETCSRLVFHTPSDLLISEMSLILIDLYLQHYDLTKSSLIQFQSGLGGLHLLELCLVFGFLTFPSLKL